MNQPSLTKIAQRDADSVKSVSDNNNWVCLHYVARDSIDTKKKGSNGIKQAKFTLKKISKGFVLLSPSAFDSNIKPKTCILIAYTKENLSTREKKTLEADMNHVIKSFEGLPVIRLYKFTDFSDNLWADHMNIKITEQLKQKPKKREQQKKVTSRRRVKSFSNVFSFFTKKKVVIPKQEKTSDTKSETKQKNENETKSKDNENKDNESKDNENKGKEGENSSNESDSDSSIYSDSNSGDSDSDEYGNNPLPPKVIKNSFKIKLPSVPSEPSRPTRPAPPRPQSHV